MGTHVYNPQDFNPVYDRECGDELHWITERNVDSFDDTIEYAGINNSVDFTTEDRLSGDWAQLRAFCYNDDAFADSAPVFLIRLQRNNGRDASIISPTVEYRFDDRPVQDVFWEELRSGDGVLLALEHNATFNRELRDADLLQIRMRDYESDETRMIFDVGGYSTEVEPYLSRNCRG